MEAEGDRSPERTRAERDFFLGLLQLREHESPEELLPKALALLVEAVGARHGYIELREADGPAERTWFAAEGYTDAEIEGVRTACSSGIIARALATGRTLHTASAMQDPRFSEFESVRAHQIQAVLCAPIGNRQARGVVYLEGTTQTGPFETRDEWLINMFARALTPICESLLENALRPPTDLSEPLPFKDLIVHSAAMRDVIAKLAVAATLDVNIMLTGPSGTGKSLLARAVHANSRRAAGPFVEVNCAAMPDTLIENELFGSAPGGHSAAPAKGSVGRVGAAEGGTLFLDDVGELTPAAQAKILQLLQSRTYFRLGDSTPRKADVRIFAATNADLGLAAAEGTFREDLLYRLRVLEVEVPTLARRPEDIRPLAERFLRQACERHGFPNLKLSPAALTSIQIADWPGNVRQLAHAIEGAAVNAMVAHVKFIEPEHLFDDTTAKENGKSNSKTLQGQLHEVRGRIVAATLEETNWNVSEAARRLDVARSYLYALIRAHGLQRVPEDEHDSEPL